MRKNGDDFNPDDVELKGSEIKNMGSIEITEEERKKFESLSFTKEEAGNFVLKLVNLSLALVQKELSVEVLDQDLIIAFVLRKLCVNELIYKFLRGESENKQEILSQTISLASVDMPRFSGQRDKQKQLFYMLMILVDNEIGEMILDLGGFMLMNRLFLNGQDFEKTFILIESCYRRDLALKYVCYQCMSDSISVGYLLEICEFFNNHDEMENVSYVTDTLIGFFRLATITEKEVSKINNLYVFLFRNNKLSLHSVRLSLQKLQKELSMETRKGEVFFDQILGNVNNSIYMYCEGEDKVIYDKYESFLRVWEKLESVMDKKSKDGAYMVIMQWRQDGVFSDEYTDFPILRKAIMNSLKKRLFLNKGEALGVDAKFVKDFFSHDLIRSVLRKMTLGEFISFFSFRFFDICDPDLMREIFEERFALSRHEEQLALLDFVERTSFFAKESGKSAFSKHPVVECYTQAFNKGDEEVLRSLALYFSDTYNVQSLFGIDDVMLNLIAQRRVKLESLAKVVFSEFFKSADDFENTLKSLILMVLFQKLREIDSSLDEKFLISLAHCPIFWQGKNVNEEIVDKFGRFLSIIYLTLPDRDFLKKFEEFKKSLKEVETDLNTVRENTVNPTVSLISEIVKKLNGLSVSGSQRDELVTGYCNSERLKSMMENEKYTVVLRKDVSDLADIFHKLTIKRVVNVDKDNPRYEWFLSGCITENRQRRNFTLQGVLDLKGGFNIRLSGKKGVKEFSFGNRDIPDPFLKEIQYAVVFYLNEYYQSKSTDVEKLILHVEGDEEKGPVQGKKSEKKENLDGFEKRIQPSRAQKQVTIDLREDEVSPSKRKEMRRKITANQALALRVFKERSREGLEDLVLYQRMSEHGKIMYYPLEDANSAVEKVLQGEMNLSDIYVRETVAHGMALGFYGEEREVQGEDKLIKSLLILQRKKMSEMSQDRYDLLKDSKYVGDLKLDNFNGCAVCKVDKTEEMEKLAEKAFEHYQDDPEEGILDEELRDMAMIVRERIDEIYKNKKLSDEAKEVKVSESLKSLGEFTEYIEKKKKELKDRTQFALKRMKIKGNEVHLAQPGVFPVERTFNQGKFISVEELGKREIRKKIV